MSARALQLAARHLKLDQMPDNKRQRLTIFQSSLTYRDDRLAGLDAAVLMEVIEHLDPERLPALERVVFGCAAPATVVVTTPNAEYNVHFATLPAGALRHRDHRFEWTRAEFRAWAGRVAGNHGYQVRFLPVGPEHPEAGPPTQLAVFEPGRRQTGAMTELNIPELSLVVLVGVTGSGKSTFARAHFKPTEVISSDFCRGLVADDENDQSATPAAFELLHYIAGQRLAGGRLTVVDATNVQPEARRELVLLAREHDVLPVAIVLDLPEKLRGAQRQPPGPGLRRARAPPPARPAAPRPARAQARGLPHGPRPAHPRRGRRRHDHPHQAVQRPQERPGRSTSSATCTAAGPSSSSCWPSSATSWSATPPAARSAPAIQTAGAPSSSATWLTGGRTRRACCAWSWAWWRPGPRSAWPATTRSSCSRRCAARTFGAATAWTPRWSSSTLETEEFRAEVDRFIDGLIGHYVLDGGRLVVAHAGLIERYHGRASGRVREFCLYGQTTGETDEYGLPVRYPWAQEYRGRAVVLYGHTPVPAAEWLNNTLCLDTGCVFGGRLTALNYPERTTVSVPAARVYHPPARPFPAVSAYRGCRPVCRCRARAGCARHRRRVRVSGSSRRPTCRGSASATRTPRPPWR